MHDQAPESSCLELRNEAHVDLGHRLTSIDASSAVAPRKVRGFIRTRAASAKNIGQDRFDNAAEPLCPGCLAWSIADQVLADLNDGIGEPATRAMLPQAIA